MKKLKDTPRLNVSLFSFQLQITSFPSMMAWPKEHEPRYHRIKHNKRQVRYLDCTIKMYKFNGDKNKASTITQSLMF